MRSIDPRYDNRLSQLRQTSTEFLKIEQVLHVPRQKIRDNHTPLLFYLKSSIIGMGAYAEMS